MDTDTHRMRIAVLADIHGNILAVEAVLRDLDSERVDRIVNLATASRVRAGAARPRIPG